MIKSVWFFLVRVVRWFMKKVTLLGIHKRVNKKALNRKLFQNSRFSYEVLHKLLWEYKLKGWRSE